MHTRSIMVMAVLAFVACHHRAGANGSTIPAPVEASSDTSARGVVRVVGEAPAPMVMLTSDTMQVRLAGPLAAELANLDGARIEVSGPVGASSMPTPHAPRTITVRRYDILEVAGGTPIVGILMADGDATFRVDTVRLADPPRDLTRFVGSKVWVVGRPTDTGELTVQAYGVLAAAPASPHLPRD